MVNIAEDALTQDEIQEIKSIYSLNGKRTVPAHPLIKIEKAALPEL